MSSIKPIETLYMGCRFRSRLEARWAVAFDSMKIEWEYEPEGFVLEDGTCYLPDFKIHVRHRSYTDEHEPIYVEVKGELTDDDLHKAELFSKEYPLLMLGNIPKNWDEYYEQYCSRSYIGFNNFFYIDGDWYPCAFSKHNGEMWLCGPDHDQWDLGEALNIALIKARSARFEHGEEG